MVLVERGWCLALESEEGVVTQVYQELLECCQDMVLELNLLNMVYRAEFRAGSQVEFQVEFQVGFQAECQVGSQAAFLAESQENFQVDFQVDFQVEFQAESQVEFREAFQAEFRVACSLGTGVGPSLLNMGYQGPLE
ncbi:hypothetical protein ANANG_G00231430 [Anguilla anguilla]|uniref:Uncharacterized protein n=1 Tax=Anguilla anguilla TaxID=7936 RepID=A0A9D3LUV4_ANGAN|nr:hypothetical protein ANANG_G00231430 [Anguilla anguilla]